MNNTKTIGPINIGNPNEISIKSLVDILLKMIHTQSVITYMDLPGDDPTVRRPDITKAQLFLNWEPSVILDDGLKKTIDFFTQMKI